MIIEKSNYNKNKFILEVVLDNEFGLQVQNINFATQIKQHWVRTN